MSNRVYYNKLVRDGIKEKIEKKGETCEVRTIVEAQEFQQELLKKVAEESSALSKTRTRDDFLDEYADLMVVLDALTKQMELTEADIKVAIEENLKRKGGYSKRHFLHWSEDTDYKSNETPQGIKL
jgi:predicted house-cleaning noncanonical NTP pyrophosphatase (MazG superfamily)